MEKLSIEFMSSVKAIGLSYSSCPYWKRNDGRPSLSIDLWFIKLFVQLPFRDCTPFGHGTATSHYGFHWWPKLNVKPRFYWINKK